MSAAGLYGESPSAREEIIRKGADLVVTSMGKAIQAKTVTYDFARLMPGATQVSCSGFGQAMISQM